MASIESRMIGLEHALSQMRAVRDSPYPVDGISAKKLADVREKSEFLKFDGIAFRVWREELTDKMRNHIAKLALAMGKAENMQTLVTQQHFDDWGVPATFDQTLDMVLQRTAVGAEVRSFILVTKKEIDDGPSLELPRKMRVRFDPISDAMFAT